MQQQKRILKVSGLRFSPKDSELFCHYLYGHIKGTLSPTEYSMVRICDLYGHDQPWTLWDRNGGDFLTVKDDLYFFTMLKKKKGNHSKRFDRTVGADHMGTWSGEDSGEQFELKLTGDGIVLHGLKKRFRYENPGVPEQSALWIMHEYSLPNENSVWVLCRLRKKYRATASMEVEAKEESKKSSTKRKRNQTKDPDDLSGKRNKLETQITLQNQETLCLSVCSQPEAIPALVTLEEKTEEGKYMNTRRDWDDFNQMLTCLDYWEPTFNGVEFNQIVTSLDDLGLNFDGWNFDFDGDDDQLFLERKTD